MKKRLIIDFEAEWVLSHRDDDSMPIEVIKEAIASISEIEIENNSLTDITVLIDDQKISVESFEKKVRTIVTGKYPQENLKDIMSVNVVDDTQKSEVDKTEVDDEEEDDENSTDDSILEVLEKTKQELKTLGLMSDDDKASAAKKGDVQTVVEQINALVGAQPFKTLADEIVKIAPETKKRKLSGLFAFQSYLFSIGDGCGFTTCLKLLAQLLSATGIHKVHPRKPVCEAKLPAPSEGAGAFNDLHKFVSGGSNDTVQVLGLDISEWMNDLDSPVFRQFLREVEKNSSSFIVVFRVPFIDKEVLAKVADSLNDILCIRTLEFPPMSESEIKCCAQKELEKYGYKVSPKAWDYFLKRIVEEKVDGRFYGINTVKKVIVELVYKKMLDNAGKKTPSDVIGKRDTKLLCSAGNDNELSGYEMLNKLVGNENIKKSIEEIIAQIEFVLKDNTQERPCIHMRFEGNPGTGKTTVARIIGKILKEKGILRVGNFYEYGGRDFCGRYVGETAPKTSSICRDAYGSVLFIDEAYSLYRGEDSGRDYGKEAIDTLIAEMENHRSDLVVIMAGYKDDMNTLMKGNLGLASRMPYIIDFPNFTREQLSDIFISMVKDKFKYDDKLFDTAKAYFLGLSDEVVNSKEFSNARFVRNLFERTWAKASLRCQLDKQATIVLTATDFERASAEKEFKTVIPRKARIGF